MARHARSLGLTLGTLLLAGTALSGCGGSSSDDTSDHATGSASPTASGTTTSGYPTGVPTGVSLTSPGTALQLGQSATVAWQPNQNLVGVLDVTVTAMHSTTFKKSFQGWELDPATKANAPYFVTATVRNAGQHDLSGQAVPLYAAAASGALVEASTFATDFKPCGPGVLPTPFPAGASADVCLVYLVPNKGSLQGVSFRPTESFDPITWSGAITRLGKGAAAPTTGASPTAFPTAFPTTSPTTGASPSVHMSGSPLH